MRFALAAIFAAFAFGWGMPATAQEVTLRFPDGSLEVTGPLLGYDGQSYRVDTRFGPLTIARRSVECSGDCPDEIFVPTIRLSGAESLADVLVPALVDAFALSLGLRADLEQSGPEGLRFLLIEPDGRENARFVVRRGTTATGVRDMVDGMTDLILADRPLTADEVADVQDAGLGDLTDRLRRRLVGKRDLRVVVPGGVTRPPLSVGTLVDLLSGATTQWDGVATTMHTLEAERDQVLARLQVLAGFTDGGAALGPVTLHPSAEALLAALNADPGAVAVTAQTLFSAQVVPVIASCGGAAPQVFLPAGLDPLTARFWIVSGAPRLPDIGRAFLVYATGPDAQRVVDRAGFIDKRPDPVTLAEQGARIAQAVLAADGEDVDGLQRMLTTLAGAERLTISFRFRPGTSELDEESLSELKVLASVLDAGTYDGREVFLVGFTDRNGPAGKNQELSVVRAGAVLAAVEETMATQATRVEMIAEGFGEVMPLACEGDAWGQHVNRRVEVWVR